MTNFSLHTRVEDTFGSGDLRLLYGMGVPFLLVVAVTIVMWATGAAWVIFPLFATIFAFTGVVLKGLSLMLDEEEDQQ